MKELPVLQLEDRIASSLKGIASTYQVLAQTLGKKRESPTKLQGLDTRNYFSASLPKYQSALGIVGESTIEGTSPQHKLNSYRSHEAMPACFEDLIENDLERASFGDETSSESTSNKHHIPKSNYFSNRMGSDTVFFDT